MSKRTPENRDSSRNSVLGVVGLASLLNATGCQESGEQLVPVDEVGFTAKNELICKGEIVNSDNLEADLFIPDPKEADNSEPNGSKNPLQEPKTDENTYDFSIDDGTAVYKGENVSTLAFSNAEELPADYFSRDGSALTVSYPVMIHGEPINCARTLTRAKTDLDPFGWQAIMSYLRNDVSFIVAMSDDPLCAEYCVVEEPGDETGEAEGETAEEETDTTGQPPVDMPDDGACEDIECPLPNDVCTAGVCEDADVRSDQSTGDQNQSDDKTVLPYDNEFSFVLTVEKPTLHIANKMRIWVGDTLMTVEDVATELGDYEGFQLNVVDCEDLGLSIIEGNPNSPVTEARFDRLHMNVETLEAQLGLDSYETDCEVDIDITYDIGKVVNYTEADNDPNVDEEDRERVLVTLDGSK